MHLDRLRNTKGEIWLNVASSYYALENFVNLDSHILLLVLDYPALSPFVPRAKRSIIQAYRTARNKALLLRHDCRKKLPVPDRSVDHILCSHFLEHVYPDEAVDILRDFQRVLKPNATIHIIVPDLEAETRKYTEKRREGAPDAADQFVHNTLLSRPSRGSVMYRALEFIGSFGLQHRWMYDRASIRARVEQLGFVILEKNETPSRAYREGDSSVHIVAQKSEN